MAKRAAKRTTGAATKRAKPKTAKPKTAKPAPPDEPDELDDDDPDDDEVADASEPGKLVDTFQGDGMLVDLVVDVDRLTIEQSTMRGDGTVDKKQVGKFATFDALCAAYPKIWQRAVDQLGGDASDINGRHVEEPMDLQAEWLRRERRATAKASTDDGVWAGKLAKARKIAGAFTGQKTVLAALAKSADRDTDVSGKRLASSLEYVIEIRRIGEPYQPGRKRERAPALPLGVSKIGGAPHLPDELDWPTEKKEPMYLLAQLSLAELAAADVSGIVPACGMLYVFITKTARGRLLYTASTSLAVRKPDYKKPPDYMQRLTDYEQRLTFEPSFYFHMQGDTDGPGRLMDALPAKFREDIAKTLGCSAKPSRAFSGDRIFGGDPVDWQAMYASYLKNPLFAQFNYSDGHVSVGIDPDDLRSAFFDDADVSYCGT